MCTTLQYWHACNHKATERFRNSMCKRAGTQKCVVLDKNRLIPTKCWECYRERKQATSDAVIYIPVTISAPDASREDDDGDVPNDEWILPSQCFIDPGLRFLDPFAHDRFKLFLERSSNAYGRKIPIDVLHSSPRAVFDRTLPQKQSGQIYIECGKRRRDEVLLQGIVNIGAGRCCMRRFSKVVLDGRIESIQHGEARGRMAEDGCTSWI